MRTLRVQFFLSYAIIGSIGPLLPVFLKDDKGFTDFQIGINQALASLATVLSPLLITLLADLQVDARRILTAAFAISTLCLSWLAQSTSNTAIVFFYMLHSLAFIPTIALQDGYYFSSAEALRRHQTPHVGYHSVRVWGTIGYIVPSLALYFLLQRLSDLHLILWCAITFATASALHAFLLPALPRDARFAQPRAKLPSLEALRLLLGRKQRFFCLGLVFAFAASSAYHGFFPLYLKRIIGIDDGLIGLIVNLGVFIEIFYILALGRLERKFGLRRIILFGLLAMATRFTLLALLPSLTTSIVTQILHGAEITAVYIVPVIYINQLAGDRFRNSIQGAYTMVVIGSSRVIGWLVAGKVAEAGYLVLFAYAAALAIAAWILLYFFFHPDKIPSRTPEAA